MGRSVSNIDFAAPVFRGEILNDTECAVCRGSLAAAQRVRKTACGHLYCSPCITRWLSENAACPLCNHDLTAEGGESRPSYEATSAIDSIIRSVIDVGVSVAADPEITFAIDGYSGPPPRSFGQRRADRGARPNRARQNRARSNRAARVLQMAVANVSDVMDKARADVIAEVARAVALLDTGRQ